MSRGVKVGIFLLGGLGLFCLGLILIGSSSQLFGSHFTVYAQFNNISSITTGSAVQVGGMAAGQVARIHVPSNPNAPFRIKLHVDDKFRHIVRADSKASIETQGMVGNQFVSLAKGSANSPECRGCTLPSQEPVDMGALMRQGQDLVKSIQATIADLRPRADSAIQNIANAAGHADGLITAVKPNVVGVSQNANAIVAGIRQGKGAAGKLLSDKKTADNVSATVANARQASASVNSMVSNLQKKDLPKVHQTLDNVQATTADMKQAMGTIMAKGNDNKNTAEALRDTVHSAQQASANMADDTEAIKHNFLFRGFFNRRGFYDLQTLTPAKYEHSDFVRKPRARVWVPAAGLFTTGKDGSLQLTADGRKILDQSMSEIVPYLPNNPLVVEGYATGGMPDQQYVASRRRALLVSQYLAAHFHLKPDRVGIMPLGEHPLPHSGRETWDGVCLVLVTWKK